MNNDLIDQVVKHYLEKYELKDIEFILAESNWQEICSIIAEVLILTD